MPEKPVAGQAVGANNHPLSAADILVVSERKELEDELKLRIYREVDAPIEVHSSASQQIERAPPGCAPGRSLR